MKSLSQKINEALNESSKFNWKKLSKKDVDDKDILNWDTNSPKDEKILKNLNPSTIEQCVTKVAELHYDSASHVGLYQDDEDEFIVVPNMKTRKDFEDWYDATINEALDMTVVESLKIRDISKVKKGNVAIDYNDDTWSVVDTAKNLKEAKTKFKKYMGDFEDDLVDDDQGIILVTDGDETVAFAYGDDGAYVKESLITYGDNGGVIKDKKLPETSKQVEETADVNEAKLEIEVSSRDAKEANEILKDNRNIKYENDGSTIFIFKKKDDYEEALDLFKKLEVISESADINEAKEIKSDSEFVEYGEAVLKKAHGDNYDQSKADKTLQGILKDADGDYGQAVGVLQAGLSEDTDAEDVDENVDEVDESLVTESNKDKDLTFTVDDEDAKPLRKALQKGDVDYEFEKHGNKFEVWSGDVEKALKIAKQLGTILHDQVYESVNE